MADFEIVATPRSDLGKAAIRRMRRTGRVPAIVYGGGKEPMPVSMLENVLRKQMDNEAFFSHVLTVKVEGQPEQQAVVKALQRHPATSRVLHLDLLRVDATHEITMQVPLHFENEEAAPGVREGGVIAHLISEVEVNCLPGNLPEYIAVDVGGMSVGASIHLSDLVLPDGVRLGALSEDSDPAVLTMSMPRGGGDDAAASDDGEGEAEEGGDA